MTKVVTTFLVLLLCCLPSCRVDEIPNENDLINVEDEFIIDMWETLSPNKRTFQFVVNTISQQDCTNAFINFSKTQQDLALSFSLNNVQFPESCIPGQAPASANIAFSNLNSGSYKISVYLKETIVNHGTLTVSSVGYTLDMETEIGYRIANNQLLKIFDKTIWGYVSYTNPDYATEAAEAIQAIAAVSETREYQMGNYGYFTVIDQDNNIEPADPINDLFQSFLHQYDGNTNQLRATIKELRNNYGDKLEFLVYTANGEEL